MLLAEEPIAAAVKHHAAEHSVDEQATWRRVGTYIDEIVPFFNILTYYKIGLVVSRVLLNFFYKVSAEYAGAPPAETLPRDAIVIYLMNHRSNADHVLTPTASSTSSDHLPKASASATGCPRWERSPFSSQIVDLVDSP